MFHNSITNLSQTPHKYNSSLDETRTHTDPSVQGILPATLALTQANLIHPTQPLIQHYFSRGCFNVAI